MSVTRLDSPDCCPQKEEPQNVNTTTINIRHSGCNKSEKMAERNDSVNEVAYGIYGTSQLIACKCFLFFFWDKEVAGFFCCDLVLASDSFSC